MSMGTKIKKKNLLAGAIGAFGMLLGDLTLSLVKPGVGDGGLFLREGYYNGGYPAWRLVVLFLTGVVGIWSYWHGLRTIEDSFDEDCRKTKACFRFCSRIYCFTGLAFHFGIGAGAYFTSYMGENVGRDAAAALATEYTTRILPSFYVVYPFMLPIFLIQLVMLLRGKTVYSRRMLLFAPVLWVAVCALVPDIRQTLGCELHTFDYVMTQCSGNFAPCLYFLACLILPDSFTYEKNNYAKQK